MLFITGNRIEKIRQALIKGSEEEKLFGSQVYYYVLLDEQTHVCGFTAHIIGYRPGDAGIEGPFYVDLVIDTPVEGISTYLQNLKVVSVVLGDRITNADLPDRALCMVDEFDRIKEIMNAPRYEDGLWVVVDNTK